MASTPETELAAGPDPAAPELAATWLGRRDFGVNRARVEALRARIESRPRA